MGDLTGKLHQCFPLPILEGAGFKGEAALGKNDPLNYRAGRGTIRLEGRPLVRTWNGRLDSQFVADIRIDRE